MGSSKNQEYYTPRPLIRAIVQVVKPQIGERVYDGAVGSAGFLCDPLSGEEGVFATECGATGNEAAQGFDVVTVWVENSCEPDTSPLASGELAEGLNANSHCLFDTFDQAYAAVEAGSFDGCEPGALRIFSVYSVDWPRL